MKTKISHLGRSSVSVILAVMMLLSTMLIGTVSTVNAVDLKGTYYFDNTDANWDNVYMVFIGTNGKYKEYHKMSVSEGKYYVYDQGASWSANGFYFTNSSNDSSDGTNTTNTFSTKPDSSKNCFVPTSSSGSGSWMSLDDAKASHQSPVADSVTLTANPTSVKAGKPVTLTPTVSGEKSDNLTYTFKKTSAGTATEVKNADNSLTVTPSEAGTYKYTVTVSAEGFSSVTSTEVSFTVTAPVQYYLAGRINQDRTDGWVQSINDKYKFTESDTEGLYYYESKNTPKQWSEKVGSKNLEQYFYIIDSSSNKYGSKDNQTDNTPKVLNSTNDKSTLEIISSTDDTKTLTYISNQENVSNVTFWLDTRNGNMQLYYTSATAYSVTFGSYDTSMGSVTAKNGSSNISSGDGVAENSEVTFTATANEGYKFDGWYSDADCTNPIDGASNVTYTVDSISNDVSAYAKFSALSYNITKEDVTNYSVEVKESAEYNSTVSVKVTATDDAYEVNGITVTDKDNNVVNVSGGESGVYTFTMPASDVTVKANSKLKQIEAPTVTFNVVGQSTADAKVLVSTPITASYTAAENSTIVEGSENVAVTDANGTTVSADKYSLVKDTATGNYTFTAKEPGTYKLSYTVTAKSINDESMTATNSPVTVTITVAYTDTQQAYVDLESYVKSVEGTSAGNYTEDSFKTFSAALKSAQALLKGLPNADATNTDVYTTALTNLQNAYKNLKSNKQYYILGHSAITGRTDDTSGATTHDNGVPMKDNGNGDYTYTFSSPDIKSGNDAFCFIDNNNKTYKTDSDNSINITDPKYTAKNPYTVDISSADKGLYYIGNPTASKRYTIHLNTATDGKIKVWVEEPPLPYGLQGAVYASQSDSNPIGWSNYSETMSFNADNNYTLKFYAKNSNTNLNQFRLIDSANNNYGSKNTSGLKVDLNTDYTTEKTSGNVYYVDYSDKPYTITLTNPGENPPTFKVTQGTQYSVTVDSNIENGKISVDNNNPYGGDTVTVTATPVSGYVLETVTFNNTPAKVVGNKATFTMPNEDVTVTATFRTAKEYKVTIANNITNGNVTANGNSKTITVTEGTPVTLVAVPDSSYSFSSWSITPEDGYTHDGSMTSAIETIYPTDNITVSASFTQGTVSPDHFLAWGEQEKISDWTDSTKTYFSTDDNGNTVYTAYLDTSHFKEKTWYRFAVTNKIPSLNDRLNSGDLHYNYNGFTVNGYSEGHEEDNVKTEPREYGGNYYGMFRYSGELVSLSISYNEGTKNYQVTPIVKVHNGAMLYAKNGSCRTDAKYPNNMHTYGTTTISYESEKYDVDIDTKPTSWQIAYLSEENIKNEVKLTITTKVTNPKYYLAGWCVDGETYLPKTSDAENNEYSFDYYVKSTTKLTDKIEVTPVYFYKTSTDTETVRFYVTGFDDTVKKDWGNTIAVYPYYSDGTGGNVFSNYPGQPMLVSGGRYYVDLPIKYNGGTIAGVTLNNFYYDDVHMGLVSSLGNRQTYDYNDFLKIYQQKFNKSSERKSHEIIFSFKYVPSGEEFGHNNFGDDSTGKGTKTYPATISANKMETVYKNGWEDLTDFYGNKVDLYNKKVDASSVDGKKNPWRVISNGYEQTYFGYYATRWAVYKPNVDTGEVTSYLLVDVISSSSLLYNNYEDILKDEKTYDAGDTSLSASSDAEAYKAFIDKGAVGVPVKITYEQTIEKDNSIEGQPRKNENAFRNDGRWYYSEDNLDVTAHTVIEYADTLNDFSGELGINFRRDYYQSDEVDYTKADYDSSQYTGQTTKTSAYFTNDGYYKKTEAKGQTGSGNTFDIIANTDHTSQYIFVGWYLLSEGKYSPLTSTVENSVSVPQNNNDVYVARFIKAPSGSLTISHKLHPNTTGLGKCYVSVDVLNSTDKVIHSYEEKTSDITVSNEYIKFGQGNKIKITLRTQPGEASTFTDFYSSDLVKLVNTQTGAVPAVTVTKNPTDGTYKAVISFNVDEYLFDKESTDYQQKIKVLNYYSLLSLGEVNYEIKYTFTTRLYGPKVYKVSDVLTKEDIEKYACTETKLSEKFVMAKAPFESNFKQNITWDSNKITFGSNPDGTLTAAITATQVEDKNVTATFRVDSDSEAEIITTDFGNRFLKKDGSYISAKDTGRTAAEVKGLPTEYQNSEGKFSFWYVMTTKNKEFVTKAYGQNFAYTGYDNYIVVAVYGVEGTHKDTPTDSSINFLQYSRNHWNDTVTGEDGTGSYSFANTEYDRLYADFNLMFNHNGYLLNKYSGTPNIKVGYAMVVGSKKDSNYTVDETELKKAISINATDGGTVEHQSTSVTAKQAVTVTESDSVVAKKNVIVNSIRIADLDNKNRITSYYGFKNSEANQSYYVKVYSYVIVGNEVTLSKTPVVINLKDIGTKTYAAPQQ